MASGRIQRVANRSREPCKSPALRCKTSVANACKFRRAHGARSPGDDASLSGILGALTAIHSGPLGLDQPSRVLGLCCDAMSSLCFLFSYDPPPTPLTLIALLYITEIMIDCSEQMDDVS